MHTMKLSPRPFRSGAIGGSTNTGGRLTGVGISASTQEKQAGPTMSSEAKGFTR